MSMGPLEVIGPLSIRRFSFAKICQVHRGHSHNYDHVTIVTQGRIKVKYQIPDGAEGESREFGPGDTVLIKAQVYHTVKALEPNTRYLCVFTHRNQEGLGVEAYEGDPLEATHTADVELARPILGLVISQSATIG